MQRLIFLLLALTACASAPAPEPADPMGPAWVAYGAEAQADSNDPLILYGVGSVVDSGAITDRLVKTKATGSISQQILETVQRLKPESFASTKRSEIPVFRARVVETHASPDGVHYALARLDVRDYREDLAAGQFVPPAIQFYLTHFSGDAR